MTEPLPSKTDSLIDELRGRRLDGNEATLRHRAAEEIERLIARCQEINDQWAGEVTSLKRETDRLRRLICEHNHQVVTVCGETNEYNAKVWGCTDYVTRERQCPNCPKDYLISLDLPHEEKGD